MRNISFKRHRFVRSLAAATGGACELLTPHEDMAARIHRHFQRLYAASTAKVAVRWPLPATQTLPGYRNGLRRRHAPCSNRPANPSMSPVSTAKQYRFIKCVISSLALIDFLPASLQLFQVVRPCPAFGECSHGPNIDSFMGNKPALTCAAKSPIVSPPTEV